MGMRFTKGHLRTILIALMIMTASLNKSYAGGFPVRPHSLLLSPSVSYFYASKFWDASRVLAPFGNDGHFSSWTYQLYAEYGLSRRFTLVAQLPYVTNTFEQTGYKSTASGLTDLETGIRYYIANIDYRYYFMVQGTVITPLYTNDLNLGYGQTGAELKFSFAGSGHLFGKNCFFSLENGFRQYFGSTGPFQDRYSGTFGLTLDKKYKNQVSVTLGGFYSESTNKSFSPIVYTNKDFAFNQVSLSYGHSFSKRFSVFVTGGKFINGRNTGDGTSGSVSLVIKPF
jgi:hypothetical protein